jgi:hypothetical protein
MPTATTTTTAAAVTTAEGLYVGTESTGRTGTGIILDDGTYYYIYSARNNSSLIAGAVTGSGISSNGSFTSSNGKDINLEGLGLQSGTLSATYTARKSFSGFFTYPSLNNQSVAISGSYSADYEKVPTLAAVVGTYTGASGSPVGTESATLTITSAGTISGRGSSGCTVTGAITPRSKGNIYTTSITFGSSPCRLPNTTLTGASYFDSGTKRLYAVGMTASRSTGFIFAGTKP